MGNMYTQNHLYMSKLIFGVYRIGNVFGYVMDKNLVYTWQGLCTHQKTLRYLDDKNGVHQNYP